MEKDDIGNATDILSDKALIEKLTTLIDSITLLLQQKPDHYTRESDLPTEMIEKGLHKNDPAFLARYQKATALRLFALQIYLLLKDATTPKSYKKKHYLLLSLCLHPDKLPDNLPKRVTQCSADLGAKIITLNELLFDAKIYKANQHHSVLFIEFQTMADLITSGKDGHMVLEDAQDIEVALPETEQVRQDVILLLLQQVARKLAETESREDRIISRLTAIAKLPLITIALLIYVTPDELKEETYRDCYYPHACASIAEAIWSVRYERWKKDTFGNNWYIPAGVDALRGVAIAATAIPAMVVLVPLFLAGLALHGLEDISGKTERRYQNPQDWLEQLKLKCAGYVHTTSQAMNLGLRVMDDTFVIEAAYSWRLHQIVMVSIGSAYARLTGTPDNGILPFSETLLTTFQNLDKRSERHKIHYKEQEVKDDEAPEGSAETYVNLTEVQVLSTAADFSNNLVQLKLADTPFDFEMVDADEADPDQTTLVEDDGFSVLSPRARRLNI